MELNKVDKEILGILKRVFLTKNINPMFSDDHMRIWIIRVLFAVSVFGLLTRVALGVFNHEVTAEMSIFFNMPIALFFGILFFAHKQ